jgi:hypothetical protein
MFKYQNAGLFYDFIIKHTPTHNSSSSLKLDIWPVFPEIYGRVEEQNQNSFKA